VIVRVIVVLLFLGFIYWSLNSLARRFALTGKQAQLVIVLGAILSGIIMLIVMGRLPIHFILAPIGVAVTFLLRMLPAALRLLPLWQMWKSKRPVYGQNATQAKNQTSTIRTQFLEMELHHDSGDMDGKVLKGAFAGSRLSELSLEQLIKLGKDCQVEADSMQILEAYLDRMHDGWRQNYESESATSANMAEAEMTRELALEVLGLSGEVTEDDIVKAHRRLMQKLHPDRGGTDYLAKKINAARDYLTQ